MILKSHEWIFIDRSGPLLGPVQDYELSFERPKILLVEFLLTASLSLRDHHHQGFTAPLHICTGWAMLPFQGLKRNSSTDHLNHTDLGNCRPNFYQFKTLTSILCQECISRGPVKISSISTLKYTTIHEHGYTLGVIQTPHIRSSLGCSHCLHMSPKETRTNLGAAATRQRSIPWRRKATRFNGRFGMSPVGTRTWSPGENCFP